MLSANVELASKAAWSPASAGGDSADQVISSDGRYIAFVSDALNLTGGQLPARTGDRPPQNIYRYDRVTGESVLVSVDATGSRPVDGDCYNPQISANGEIVAFESEADDIHPFATDSRVKIFARNITTGITYLVSQNVAGNGGANKGRAPEWNQR